MYFVFSPAKEERKSKSYKRIRTSYLRGSTTELQKAMYTWTDHLSYSIKHNPKGNFPIAILLAFRLASSSLEGTLIKRLLIVINRAKIKLSTLSSENTNGVEFQYKSLSSFSTSTLEPLNCKRSYILTQISSFSIWTKERVKSKTGFIFHLPAKGNLLDSVNGTLIYSSGDRIVRLLSEFLTDSLRVGMTRCQGLRKAFVVDWNFFKS